VLQCGFRTDNLMQQGPAAAAHDQHLMGTCLAVPVGVFARPVHVEAVMCVLDGGYCEPLRSQAREEVSEQGGLAAA
jgi:hypothetical protein